MGGGVALTFDDGPNPVWTPRVLDALAGAGARATFFVVAPFAERYPSVLRRIAAEGHEVGFHCGRHVRHDRMSPAEILADAREGLRVLRGLGHRIGDWRTPWGVVTADTVRVADSLGLRLVGWTGDSEDWAGYGAEGMLGRLEPGIEDGAVLLLHDAVGPGALRDGCAETVALVGPLVGLTRSRGLEPVTLGGMSGVPERNPGGVSGV